ncbi:MAG: T9SS type A sorting domain-containing protein [Candidatus Cloacimonadota bacterium]|nr:MAG: T9SS type A sorting domain-containing protein [Candidatus Cloacimonadota bacterium]
MKFSGLLFLIIFLLSRSLLFGNYPLRMEGPMLPTLGEESCIHPVDNPPPLDTVCLVYEPVWYGGSYLSPQNYVNAKHITNVIVGSYSFPVVIWETETDWGQQSLFSYWDDLLKCWSYPDSFTSNQGRDTGRGNVCADSKGNLHFAWHQIGGTPDGYEVFYARAFLDTSGGIIQYNVERPAIMISATNGEEEYFPSMAINNDSLIMIVFTVGVIVGFEHAIGYNYSTDGGETWVGQGIAYEHGSEMPGSWLLPSIASNPNRSNTTTPNKDMWVAFNFDYDDNMCMDILALYWDAVTNTWNHELVALGQSPPNDHALCCPAIVVDYNGVPHIIFQENMGTGGGQVGLLGFNVCGPAGTLWYTHKLGDCWHTPVKIMFPRYEVCNYESGYPSAGIGIDNKIYFSTTQPESASQDTGAYPPFNVYYAAITPYAGTVRYGGKVSSLSYGDSRNAIYAHTTYYIQEGKASLNTQGCGITWCQMANGVPPAGVYYSRVPNLNFITGIKEISNLSLLMLYQNYPNPVREKTTISFTVPNNTSMSLDIYDISGRLVKNLANGVPGAGSYFVVWDGKDLNGKDVPDGVYLYTLRAGSYIKTRKLLLIQ